MLGLFEAHARSHPDAPAVMCGNTSLTYGELDHRAHRVARLLLGAGLTPGQLIAVAMDRTVDAVVAVLGVLKSGGVYVPIDPGSPVEILRTNTEVAAIVTHRRHLIRLMDRPSRRVICLDRELDTGAPADLAPLRVDAPAAERVACVIYTSGTTGTPVGAMMNEGNLAHAYAGWREVYGLTPDDRHLQVASMEFDVFTADWIRALCSGAALVMAEQNFMHDRTADIADLHRVIVEHRITVLECNVRTVQLLFGYLRAHGLRLGSVRLLAVGTDRWYVEEHLALQEYLGPSVRVLNTYGLAEATVDSTYHELGPSTPQGVSLVGVPFPRTRIHILTEDGTVLPAGEAGEICVAGAGVGPGYFGRPDLTAQRFPRSDVDPDGRVLRTGDLGRIRPDGVLEYLCRKGASDAAALEIATVEAALRGFPGVREALVVDHSDGLAGYVMTESGEVDRTAILAYLAGRVPGHLVPVSLVRLDVLPRNRAGKIDRARLPRPLFRDGSAPRPDPADSAPAPAPAAAAAAAASSAASSSTAASSAAASSASASASARRSSADRSSRDRSSADRPSANVFGGGQVEDGPVADGEVADDLRQDELRQDELRQDDPRQDELRSVGRPTGGAGGSGPKDVGPRGGGKYGKPGRRTGPRGDGRGRTGEELAAFGAAKSAFGGQVTTGRPTAGVDSGFAWLVLTAGIATVALWSSQVVWPGATDLTLVPQPWALLFFGLYVCEALAFGLGVTFLLLIGPRVVRRRRPRWGRALYLAVAWLLIAWWPQDNLYRLAAKNDWPRQAALVYGFNITLMIAGAIVAAFAFRTLVTAQRR